MYAGFLHPLVAWPSGKAKVCKTFIHQFKSGRHLQKDRLGLTYESLNSSDFLFYMFYMKVGSKATDKNPG